MKHVSHFVNQALNNMFRTQAIDFASKLKIPPRDKLVLLCMAKAANDEEFVCTIKPHEIAKHTELPVLEVINAMLRLQDNNVIELTREVDLRDGINYFRINMQSEAAYR